MAKPASAATAALSTIANQIPAEGLAVYIAIYTVAPYLWPLGKDAAPNWIVAFVCVVIAVASTCSRSHGRQTRRRAS